MSQRKLSAALALVAGMFAVSFMGVFSRKLDCSNASVQLLRSLFSTLGFALVFGWRGGRVMFLPLPRGNELKVYVMYAAGIIGASLFFMMSFRYTTFANAIIIHYLTPFLVILGGGLFLGERIRRRHLLAAALALAGIWLGVKDNLSFELSRNNLMGNGAALMSVFGFGTLILVTRHTRQLGLPMGRTLFYSWGMVLLFFLPLQVPFGRLPLTAANLGYGALTALVGTVFVYVMMNVGMRRLGAGLASVVMFSEVVFTIMNGAVFFGEAVTPMVWLGCGVIFAAIVLASAGPRHHQPGRPLTARPPAGPST